MAVPGLQSENAAGMAAHPFEVSEDVIARLRELGAAKDVAFSTALAAAFAALLYRYSCEGTLTIKTKHSGRSDSGVRLLPVNAVVSSDLSFERMLECARQILPNAPELHGSDEWAELREIAILAPLETRNELVRSPSSYGQEDESHGLKVAFRKGPAGWSGRFEYKADTFEEIRMARMVGHLQTLLRGVTDSPAVPISKMNMLEDREKREILIEWNRTDCATPEATVPELLEGQVQRAPHAVALIQGDQKLTYKQLDEEANRLANHLRARGVQSETLVGLCVEQSLNAVVAVLGILKAGGAYVPLDPAYPRHRLEEMVSDSKLAIAVTSARCGHRVPPGIETICLDRDAARLTTESSAPPVTKNTPDSAAYVLYTSASTGKPKAVVGIHRSITNGLKSVTYAPDEVCCLNSFLSYGFSISNLFLPIISGVPLVILTDDQIRDTNQMIAVLEKEGVTRLVVVPAVLKQILEPDFEAESRLGKIRTIGAAGAKLTPAHLQRFTQVLPQVRLHNRYASTEIGTVAAICELDNETLAGGGDIALGRPVANTRIYILDESMNPVPVGVVGELYIGAAHLARGYLNRPDLTAERFLPDPFSAEPGRRLYRTGDLGRFRSNGDIEFAGRTDHQVKINGFRIDLPEVERALRGHLGVSEAITAVREIGNRRRLVAYVVTKPIGTPSASQLRGYLSERLPNYMVPSKFVFLNELPMGSNGKPDRAALPRPEPIRPKLEAAYEPPGSPMESALAQIWSDVLGLDPIGVHDNFLDLGGDSLSAAQVAVRICERFDMEITPEALADRPTIAELAVYLADPGMAGEPHLQAQA